MKHEASRFVLLALRPQALLGEAALSPPPSKGAAFWNRALAAASELHALAPFARAVSRQSWFDECGPEFQEKLRGVLAQERMKLALLDLELEASLNALDPIGVRAIVLKGMDVGTRLYPERILRPMSDVDLLVKESDYTLAIRALAQAGFRPVTSISPARGQVELVRVEGGAVVELHAARGKFGAPGIWDRAAPGEGVSGRGLRMSNEDFFCYGVRHAAIQHALESPIWLNDLYFLLKNAELDWDWIFEEQKRARALAGTWLALGVLERFTGFCPDSVCLERFGAAIHPVRRKLLQGLLDPELWFLSHPRPISFVMGARFLARDSVGDAVVYAAKRTFSGLA